MKIQSPKVNGYRLEAHNMNGVYQSNDKIHSPRKKKTCLNKADGYIHKQNIKKLI